MIWQIYLKFAQNKGKTLDHGGDGEGQIDHDEHDGNLFDSNGRMDWNAGVSRPLRSFFCERNAPALHFVYQPNEALILRVPRFFPRRFTIRFDRGGRWHPRAQVLISQRHLVFSLCFLFRKMNVSVPLKPDSFIAVWSCNLA
ncbi:MAG: hypothetical protein LBI87_12120 [Candidatus Accumulibacter sp.]|jgi:hypothetical protein|nr:hypothetical protein [Accumulibacter sp.]